MPLPLTVSCFSKIQIGFTFLVPAHLGSPGKRAVKWVCVCVCHLKKQPQNKSVFSFLCTYALETFLTTTLYKSTFTIPYYNNVALPASHAFANRCCCKLSSNRSISPARWAHSSKPAAADFLLWAHAGTDGRTLYHHTDHALDW